MTTPICRICGEEFNIKRKELGYDICLQCGEELACRKKQLLYETLNDYKERVITMVYR